MCMEGRGTKNYGGEDRKKDGNEIGYGVLIIFDIGDTDNNNNNSDDNNTCFHY